MAGTKRYILLIISLTIFLTAESAVKYRTPELKRLAQIVGAVFDVETVTFIAEML